LVNPKNEKLNTIESHQMQYKIHIKKQDDTLILIISHIGKMPYYTHPMPKLKRKTKHRSSSFIKLKNISFWESKSPLKPKKWSWHFHNKQKYKMNRTLIILEKKKPLLEKSKRVSNSSSHCSPVVDRLKIRRLKIWCLYWVQSHLLLCFGSFSVFIPRLVSTLTFSAIYLPLQSKVKHFEDWYVGKTSLCKEIQKNENNFFHKLC